MARDRSDSPFDFDNARDDDDPPPRRGGRRRDREDDYDDYDDYDDRPGRGRGEMGPLDGMYRDTSMVVLILFAICCGGIAFILSLIAFLTAKDPQAKSNAMVVLLISGILTAIGIVVRVAGFAAGMGGGR